MTCGDPDGAARWETLGPGENTGGATSAALGTVKLSVLSGGFSGYVELDSDTAEVRSDERAFASCSAAVAAAAAAVPVELAIDVPDSLSTDAEERSFLEASASLLALRDDRSRRIL